MGQERRLLSGAVQLGEALGDGEELGKLRRRVVVRQEKAPAQKAGENVGIGGSGCLHVSSPESFDAVSGRSGDFRVHGASATRRRWVRKEPGQDRAERVIVPDLNDVPLGRRRREETRLLRSRGLGGREPQLGDAIPETRGPVRPHEELQVAAPPAPACGERAVVLAPDEEAGTRRVGQKGRERPEEAGLLDVGPAVLGAEDVAVPAVVAGVGPVRELVRR